MVSLISTREEFFFGTSDFKQKRISISKSDFKERRISIGKSDFNQKRISIGKSDFNQNRISIGKSDFNQKRISISKSDFSQKRVSIGKSDFNQKKISIGRSDFNQKRISIGKSDFKKFVALNLHMCYIFKGILDTTKHFRRSLFLLICLNFTISANCFICSLSLLLDYAWKWCLIEEMRLKRTKTQHFRSKSKKNK